MNLFKKIPLLLLLTLPAVAFAQNGPPNNKEEFEKGYKWRIRMTELNGVYIPKDLADAFVQLNEKIDAETKAKIRSHPEEEMAKKLYFSFGRWMTVNWSFYEGSRFSHYLKGIGITHPDDMSNFVMITYHRHLSDKPLNVKELVERYKDKRKKEAEEKLKKGTILSTEKKKKEGN